MLRVSVIKARLGLLLVGLVVSLSSLTAQGEVGLGAHIGFPVFPIPGMGADLFWSSRHYTLGVRYSVGEVDFKKVIEKEVDIEKAGALLKEARVDTSLAMAEMRLFFLWGLNLSLGVGRRTIDFNYAIHDASDLETYLQGTIKTMSTVSSIGLGVMGRWQRFFLGLDLVSIMTPRTYKASCDTVGSGALSTVVDSLNEKVAKFAENIGKAPSAQALILSLGLLF